MQSRRSILEVLKFLPAHDLLQSTSTVNSLYAVLSSSNEVWFEFLPDQAEASSSPKEQYRQLLRMFVPLLTATHLHRFCVVTRKWTGVPLSTAVEITRSTCILPLAGWLVFVTGGENSARDTFSVDCKAGTVTILQHLLVHRGSMGAIKCGEDIYAFCGFQCSYMKCCEVFDTVGKVWRKLPPALNERSAFNPCQRQGKVYLLGGCGAEHNEYFHVKEAAFHPLLLRTPHRYCTIALCSDTELIAVQRTGYYSTTDETREQWEMEDFGFNFDRSFWSNYAVIEAAGVHYILQLTTQRVVALALKEKKHAVYQPLM